MNENVEDQTPIQKFYSGASIFVTGATGFLGKCLLEKLLRTCSDLRIIYVLVREKRGKDAASRLEELFQDHIFDTIKEKSDKFRAKVVAIRGDVTAAGLGLSLHDRGLLVNEVNVVFHVAATVKFDETLKIAVSINLNGTKELLELAKKMGKLKSIIHVSTAYSHSNRKTIDEQFYKHSLGPDNLMQMLDKLTDKQIIELTPRLLGDWPNTYTYTKAMAETLVESNCGTLPIAVFRPAIIVSTWKEPLQGWVDNIYGPTGICAGALMGVVGSLQCEESAAANVVPVDMTVNALISCAWDTARKFHCHEPEIPSEVKKHQEELLQDAVYESPPLERRQSATIYNYVSSIEKPVNWGEFCAINMMLGYRYPLKDAVWYMDFKLTKHALAHSIYMFIFHLIPALIIDGLLILTARKPRMMKIYRQTEKFTKILTYFTTRDWIFNNENVQSLWLTLDNRDKKLFFFNMAEMNWLDYFKEYMLGIRLYLYKDDLTSLAEARRRQTRLFVASKCLKMIFFYISIYILLCVIHTLFKYFIFFVKL